MFSEHFKHAGLMVHVYKRLIYKIKTGFEKLIDKKKINWGERR